MDKDKLERFDELADSGEIVSMTSLLAFDEDIYCRRCGGTFTLMDGQWEGAHPEYPAVQAFGIKCTHCDRVNVSYYKTQKLVKLENRIKGLSHGKHREKAVKKYRKEFEKVQRRYGNL